MNRFKERIIFHSLQAAAEALHKHDKTKAISQASKVLEIDSNNIDAMLILAALAQPQESFQHLMRVLELEPENQQARKGLDWLSSRFNLDQLQLLGGEPQKFTNTDPQIESKLMEIMQEVSAQRLRAPLFFRFFSRWQTLLALFFVLIVILTAVLAPVIAPLDEENTADPYYRIVCTRLRCMPEKPSEESPLGTIKEFDVFHTLIWGTRQALMFGVGAALSTAVIGTILGASSAYIGGWFDRVVMRICDAFLAFPIIAAIAMFAQVVALLTPTSWGMTMAQFEAIPEHLNIIQAFIMRTDPILLALVLFSWMPYTRIIHSQVLHIKKSEFVEAATAVGSRRSRILFKHILPNTLSPAVVTATRDIGRMVVAQASFTFIGVGSSSSWALLLNIGKDWIIGPGGNLMTRWWIYLPITLAVVFFGFSWSFLGDEVNIWLNPRNQ